MHQNLFIVLFVIPALFTGMVQNVIADQGQVDKAVLEKTVGEEKSWLEVREDINESWIGVEIGSETLSKYVDQNGLLWSNQGVTQSYLRLTLQGEHPLSGLYAEVWHSASWKNDGSDEIDGTIGLQKTIGHIDLDVGLSYLDLERFGETEGNVWLPFWEISKTFTFDDAGNTPDCNALLSKELRPFIRFESAFPVNGNEEGTSSGNSVFVGVEFNSDMTPELTLNQTLTVSYDDGVYGAQCAFVGSYEASLEYALNEIVSIYGSIRAVGPFTQSGDGIERETQVIYGGGITLAF